MAQTKEVDAYLVLLYDPDQPARRFEIDGLYTDRSEAERHVASFNDMADRRNLVLRARIRIQTIRDHYS